MGGVSSPTWSSAAGAGHEGGDDVRGVPIEGAPRAVVSHRRARIGMRGGLLHVTESDTGVEGGGDEGVPQRMR